MATISVKNGLKMKYRIEQSNLDDGWSSLNVSLGLSVHGLSETLLSVHGLGLSWLDDGDVLTSTVVVVLHAWSIVALSVGLVRVVY